MSAPDKLSEVLQSLTPENGLNTRLSEGNETPLIWAVSQGYHDIAVTLIEAGADLDAQNSMGNTALLRAACEGRTRLAKLLIRVGAEVDLQNEDGYSALILAQRRGHTEIVDVLRQAGADPSLVTKLGTTLETAGDSPREPLAGRRDAALEQQIIDAIETCHGVRTGGRGQTKTINLNADDRFVPTDVLRRAYVHYDASLNPTAPNYVTLDDWLELGIAASAVPEISRAVSSLLARSLDDARNDRGGYLPPAVVERVQREIISPWGVAYLWGITGHRFLLSQPAGEGRREIIATILVGRSKDTVFFFTGRYNNLRHSTILETVDFEQPDRLVKDPNRVALRRSGGKPVQAPRASTTPLIQGAAAAQGHQPRWFDRFSFPPVDRFKPKAYHHIANFVVAKEHRRKRLSRLLLNTIVEKYSFDHLQAHGNQVEHAQHLLCGRGFWLIGDPPWFARMKRLGFYMRWGAESFFLEHDWAPLPPITDPQTGEPISNVAYNQTYGLPERYEGKTPPDTTTEHLPERIEHVIRLAQDPRAKLQYTQTMFDFL